jgi:hypothetical protein
MMSTALRAGLPLDLVYELADDHAVVLLNGGGLMHRTGAYVFRLANLADDSMTISAALSALSRAAMSVLSGARRESGCDQAQQLRERKAMVGWFIDRPRSHLPRVA